MLWDSAAEQQKHALPRPVGCRVGDGERAACRKGSGCPTLPGPRNEPIMSWGLGIGPVPKGSNAEGNREYPPVLLSCSRKLHVKRFFKIISFYFLIFTFLHSFAWLFQSLEIYWSTTLNIIFADLFSHLVVQERGMARQCWGLLYVVWTEWMKAHWLAEVGPQTSLLEGQWLRLQ